MKSNAIRVIVGVAILAGSVWAFVQWRHSTAVARIPSPPPARAKSVTAHIAEKYEAARKAPASPVAVGALCVAYHADMLFSQADRCYALAMELDSSQWRWRYYRALIQAERGEDESLVEDLRLVLEQAPGFGPAWQRLGDALFKARRYDEAREAWQRAATAPPSDANQPSPRHVTEVPLSAYANVGLARIALVRGEMNKAQKILELVAAETPQFSSAPRLLADVYRTLGRKADAERLVSRANGLHPFAPYLDPMVDDLTRESRNSSLLLRVSSEANLAVNAEWAEYLTRRAVEFDPDNAEARTKLGVVLIQQGRVAQAREQLEAALRADPSLGPARQALESIGR